MSIFWRHSFGSAPIDEVKLSFLVTQILDSNAFVADKPENVLAVCSHLDGIRQPRCCTGIWLIYGTDVSSLNSTPFQSNE